MKRTLVSIVSFMSLISILFSNCNIVYALTPNYFHFRVENRSEFEGWLKAPSNNMYEVSFLDNLRELKELLVIEEKEDFKLYEIWASDYDYDGILYTFDDLNSVNRIRFYTYWTEEKNKEQDLAAYIAQLNEEMSSKYDGAQYSSEVVKINGIDTTVYYINAGHYVAKEEEDLYQSVTAFFELEEFIVKLTGNMNEWDSAYLDFFDFNYFSMIDTERSIGDVNDDGKVNAVDALEVLKYVAKMNTLTSKDGYYADICRDNEINAEDALMILKDVAKIE